MRICLIAASALALLGAPAGAQDIVESAAYENFLSTYSDACMLENSAARDYYPPERWDIEWAFDHDDTPQTAVLHQFFCSSGAYNAQFVYYLEHEYGGALPVSFAVPVFDVKYVDDNFEGDVESISIRGFGTADMLTNSSYDPETKSIADAAYWRGIGDASSNGVWRFDKGRFVLKTYDVDASYDGEINPERLIAYK